MNDGHDPDPDVLPDGDGESLGEVSLPSWFEDESTGPLDPTSPAPTGELAGEALATLPTAEAETTSLASLPPPVSRREIVLQQFRKHGTAVWGWRVTKTLIFLAIFAPILASGEPYYWSAPAAKGGGWGLPWFANLFDRNVYQFVLDRLFNLVMILVALRYVLRGLIWLGSSILGDAGAGKGLDRWVGRLAWAVGGVLALSMVLPHGEGPVGKVIGAIDPTTSAPRIAYADEARKAEAHEAAAREYASADAARQAELLAEMPTLAKRDDEGKVLGVWSPEDWSFSLVPTPVPYGYREQLPELEDRFITSFDFRRGPHVLGTDESGRDVFAQVLYGTRIAMTVGIVAVSIYILIGTILGALAGFFLGWVDTGIMRLVEVFLCVPSLFLLLMIISVTPAEYRTIFLIMAVIGLISWTGTTRLVRGEFLKQRNQDYVAAAKMLGMSKTRIIFRHILPNSLTPVLVTASFGVAGAILTESGLSFLGLGDPNVPSWGALLNEGRTNARWHLIVPPSVAIFITVTALNLVGDGLRDALDPKLRK